MVAQLILGLITGISRVECPKDDPVWQGNRWIYLIRLFSRRHHQIPAYQYDRRGVTLRHGPRSPLLVSARTTLSLHRNDRLQVRALPGAACNVFGDLCGKDCGIGAVVEPASLFDGDSGSI